MMRLTKFLQINMTMWLPSSSAENATQPLHPTGLSSVSVP